MMAGLQLNIQKRGRLADQLYGQLLQKIVAGDIREGDKLPSENEISRAYHVSRPVIREALLRLQVDGLVYSRQGVGSFVKARPPEGLILFAEPSDVAGLLHCFEARLPFEGTAAGLAASRATSDDIANIEVALKMLEVAMQDEGLADKADFNFHMSIAKATGNDFYVSILASLNSAIKSGMQVALKITKGGSQDHIQKISEEHRSIFETIATRDASAADLSMRYHIHRARSRVTDHMRDK